MAAKLNVLAITDQLSLRVSEILNALRMVKKEGVEQMDPLIITQWLSQGVLPVEFSFADFVVGIYKSSDILNKQFFAEISRVLKPGGSVFVCLTSQSPSLKKEKYSIERQLLLAGFLDVEAFVSGQMIRVSGKKTCGKTGSSFSIKKEMKGLSAVSIDDDMDLIEEDLKKPQPPVGDCEVGKTRNACKNCTCGQAEAEEKSEKIKLTMDQVENPRSACRNCGLGDSFRCNTCTNATQLILLVLDFLVKFSSCFF